MIQIQRVEEPIILKKNAKKWEKELLAIKAKIDVIDDKKSSQFKKIKLAYTTAEARYNHKEIKDLLKGESMFNGKYAYCESQILHIDYGHIEHFYPKSKYPEKAFDWENLLLACGVCNGINQKGDNFPIDNNDPLLINPCEDNPDAYFTFEYDSEAELASVYGKNMKGETTEKLLKLNRRELIRHRSEFIKKLVILASHSSQNIQAKKLLEEACEAQSEYSAFARVIFANLQF